MTNLFQDALSIKDDLVKDRRFFHQNPELGLKLYKTADYVEARLKEMGYEPQRVGEAGVTALIGKEGGKTFLLRGDMDALPVVEEADVEFKSTNGNMHGCGHDFHAANLLGAAKLLKMHEDKLEGQVKLMFQPAEETMEGAKMMIENGVLENPKVDAALGIHVFVNIDAPVGTVTFMGRKSIFAAVDWFTIEIQGKGCHGAQPHNGVDPLTVMTHIHMALKNINAREVDPSDDIVLTVGQMHGGNTSNVIPDTAMMSGTIRTVKNETRAMVKKRVEEIVDFTAKSFRAEAKVVWGAGAPVLFHDTDLYNAAKGYLLEVEGLNVIDNDDIGVDGSLMGSEDFAYIANEVPSLFLSAAAGGPNEGCTFPLHHPKALFDERALPASAAVYAQIAMRWLEDNK
ncbi:MAG TPA: amidohydrolase [Clostridiaceae bacterium]|mgnify:CR=1 FL=1|jgi:amidohydrolase|nr:amidohydrolase [Clostridiaceae bacterium]